MSGPAESRDVERGVLTVAQRLRVYAAVHEQVRLTLTAKNALRLADEIQAGRKGRAVSLRIAMILARREREMRDDRLRLVFLGAMSAALAPHALDAAAALIGLTPEMARAAGAATADLLRGLW